MAHLLKELKVRGDIQKGIVPKLEELNAVFSKKDAIGVLHATLVKMHKESQALK